MFRAPIRPYSCLAICVTVSSAGGRTLRNYPPYPQLPGRPLQTFKTEMAYRVSGSHGHLLCRVECAPRPANPCIPRRVASAMFRLRYVQVVTAQRTAQEHPCRPATVMKPARQDIARCGHRRAQHRRTTSEHLSHTQTSTQTVLHVAASAVIPMAREPAHQAQRQSGCYLPRRHRPHSPPFGNPATTSTCSSADIAETPRLPAGRSRNSSHNRTGTRYGQQRSVHLLASEGASSPWVPLPAWRLLLAPELRGQLLFPFLAQPFQAQWHSLPACRLRKAWTCFSANTAVRRRHREVHLRNSLRNLNGTPSGWHYAVHLSVAVRQRERLKLSPKLKATRHVPTCSSQNSLWYFVVSRCRTGRPN